MIWQNCGAGHREAIAQEAEGNLPEIVHEYEKLTGFLQMLIERRRNKNIQYIISMRTPDKVTTIYKRDDAVADETTKTTQEQMTFWLAFRDPALEESFLQLMSNDRNRIHRTLF